VYGAKAIEGVANWLQAEKNLQRLDCCLSAERIFDAGSSLPVFCAELEECYRDQYIYHADAIDYIPSKAHRHQPMRAGG
jgi:hypothetical protein